MTTGKLILVLMAVAVLALGAAWLVLDGDVSGRSVASKGKPSEESASRDEGAGERTSAVGARNAQGIDGSESAASRAGERTTVPDSNTVTSPDSAKPSTPVGNGGMPVPPSPSNVKVQAPSELIVAGTPSKALSAAAAAFEDFKALEAKDPKDDKTTELRSTGWTRERLDSRLRAKGITLPPTILTDVTGKIMVHGVNKALPYARVVLHSFVPERNIRGSALVPFATEFLCDDKGQFNGKVPLGETKPDDYPALVVSVWVGDTIPQYDPEQLPKNKVVLPPITPGMLAICGRPVITGAPGETTSLGIFFSPDHPSNLAIEGTSVPEAIGQPIRFTGQADPARWHVSTRAESLALFPILRSEAMWRMESGEERHIYRCQADAGKTNYLAYMTSEGMLRAETRRLWPNEAERTLPFWQLSPVDNRLYALRAKFNPVGTIILSGQVMTSLGGLDGAQVLCRGGREVVTTIAGPGGWFTLDGIVSGGSIIEVSHESWTTEIVPLASLRRQQAPTVTMSAPRPDFTLSIRNAEDGSPVQHVVMRMIWARKKLEKGKVVTEDLAEVTQPAASDGKYRVTGEWALSSLIISAPAYRPTTVDLKPLQVVGGGYGDVLLVPVRAFMVRPVDASLLQTRPDGAKWEIPQDGSGHIYTYWGNLFAEYTVNFDQGVPEALSRPVPFDLVIGARNQGIVDNDFSFRIDVYVDDVKVGYRTIFADSTNERTATLPLGKLQGTRKIKIVWLNDKWIPGELDANIRLTSLRFVETIEEPAAPAKGKQP